MGLKKAILTIEVKKGKPTRFLAIPLVLHSESKILEGESVDGKIFNSIESIGLLVTAVEIVNTALFEERKTIFGLIHPTKSAADFQ